MPFADIHIHALYGVDDGAETQAQMQAMADASYADGVRILCVTPHFHPGYFGDNCGRADAAYQRLEAYVRQKYPDMRLYRGNELRYERGCVSWLRSGQCRSLNGTQYVLVDFSEAEEAGEISGGLDRLLNAGYRPVLAHAERYRSLWGKLRQLRAYRENGVVLQADAQSPLGGFGLRTRQQCRALLAEGLVDLIGSDGHDTAGRPPVISPCFQYISKKHGTDYAEALCFGNASILLQEAAVKEDFD